MLKLFTLLIVCMLYTNSVWCQKVTLTSDAPKCNGGKDGSLSINIEETSTTYNLRLMLAKNNKLVFEGTYSSDTTVQISGLVASDYAVRLVEAGRVVEATHTIEELLPLNANIIEVTKKLSSDGSCDAMVKALPTGGTMPCKYLWSENTGSKTTAEISGLCKGIYRCIINDYNNCGEVSATVFLKFE